uniref:Empty spiracles homeobox 3 n=1 Tax=Acanthochromis polyacanthus TaxID=80966 RepID=A0A3Q1F746_9TELE
MFQHGSGKKCFTIESLVGKEASGSGDEPIRPTALRFPESLHPSAAVAAAAAAAGVFGFQGGSGRTLFSAGPDMVLQEPGTHTQGPGGLPLHPLQIPPQSFFSPQHRDALSFYPWVLRSRYLGHRFTGEGLLSHFVQTEPLQLLPLTLFLQNLNFTHVYRRLNASLQHQSRKTRFLTQKAPFPPVYMQFICNNSA